MKIGAKSRAYQAHLGAVLVHSDGTQEIIGDLDARKPWYQRLWEYVCFDERGLITDQALNDIANDLVSGSGLTAYKYHDSGTGTSAAAQTDTTLQTQAGPTTRATGTNTQTQSASGTGSTTPAIVQSVGTISYTSSLAITEWGLFNQAAQGGHMFDHRVFAAINVVSGDSIQFTYSVSIPGGGS
jgi:hypothetical protein